MILTLPDFCILLSALGFFLLPWTYYRYRTSLSRWDAFVMSMAMIIPTAFASATFAGLLLYVLDLLLPRISFQPLVLIALFLPWTGIIWFPLSARLGKKVRLAKEAGRE